MKGRHAERGKSHAPTAGTKPALALVLIVFALVFTADALVVFWRQMPQRDFGAFYFSGRAWNNGDSVYTAGRPDLPNLNPPGVIVALFAPLARLPMLTAGAIWQLLGAAALMFSAIRIVRALALPARLGLLVLGLELLTVPARYVWLEGQITWILLVPTTEAWLAYRRSAYLAAGVWLGPVIAIKPFFALTAVALGVVTAAAAALTSAALTGLCLTFTSLATWYEWIALGPRISVTWPSSASLWTLGARLQGARPLDVLSWTDLSGPIILAVGIVGLALLILTLRQHDLDARWAGSVVLALLISPLGWIYYLPLAMGALIAMWWRGRWSIWLTAAIGLCCIPMLVHFWAIEHGRWLAVSLGAAYTWALLIICVGLMTCRSKAADVGSRKGSADMDSRTTHRAGRTRS